MSHILRNRSASSERRPRQAGNIVPRQISSDDGKRASYGSQSQQVVQRRPATQANAQMQPQRYATPQQRENQVTRTVTTAEVLADMQVLEQQQRDAQKRLANTNVIRQNQVSQRAVVETRLTWLKYSNGEKRAQYVRCGELLSSSHRELTGLQTGWDRNADTMRRLDAKFAKGVAGRRTTLGIHENIDSQVNSIIKKESFAAQLRVKALEKLEAENKKCEELSRHQQRIVVTHHDERKNMKNCGDATADTKRQNLQLEQEEALAKQLLLPTRMRAESALHDLAVEAKESGKVVTYWQNKSQDTITISTSVEANDLDLLKKMEQKKEAMQSLRLRLLDCNAEKGEHASDSLASVSAISVLEDLQKAIDSEQDALNNEVSAKNCIASAVEYALLTASQKAEETSQINEQCIVVSALVQTADALEHDRRTSAEAILDKLTEQREVVFGLNASMAQLSKKEEQESVEGARLINVESSLHKRRLADLDCLVRELETEKTSLDFLKKSNQDTIDGSKAKVDQAKVHLSEAKQGTEQLRDCVKLIPSADDDEKEMQNTIEATKTARAFLVNDVKAEIAYIKKKYPPLRDAEITCDLSKPAEELGEDLFKDLIAQCQEVITLARKRRDEQKSSSLKSHQKERSRRAYSEGAKRQSELHDSHEVRSEARQESRSARKVTFLDDNGSSTHLNDISRTKGMSKPAVKDNDIDGTRPKKSAVELDSKYSSSPIPTTEINSIDLAEFHEPVSEARPRDLLPAFTQASIEDDSIASVQEEKQVHSGLNKKTKQTRDAANVGETLRETEQSIENNKVSDSKTRRSYGATKPGNGALLRHHRPSKVSTKTSTDDQTSRRRHLSNLHSSDVKVGSHRERHSVGPDVPVRRNKTSGVGGASVQRKFGDSGLSLERTKKTVDSKLSRKKYDEQSRGARLLDAKKVSSAGNGEGDAKEPKADLLLKPVAKRAAIQYDGKVSRRKVDEAPSMQPLKSKKGLAGTDEGEGAHGLKASAKRMFSQTEGKVLQSKAVKEPPRAQSQISRKRPSAVAEGSTQKRKPDISLEPSSKRSRVATTSRPEPEVKAEKSKETFKVTASTSFHGKSSLKESGKSKEATGSTQASGISSMERVPPKKPKKRAVAPNVSRGLAPLVDTDEYNFHPTA